MGRNYESNNSFNNFLIDLILENDVDITTKKNKVQIANVFTSILTTFVDEEEYVKELNFDIVKDGEDNFKVLAHNAITALWLCGYHITDPELADVKYYDLDIGKMMYDDKLLKLVPYEEK